ncbi:VOC family protein [Halorarum halophilum]|uniref:VOC family protein n=1 Tax=Halorarum halophilum TaxID=2743090 RepID=A0A7D5KXZ0_9EURY|nr:VOC family protein [Halobaculum halophilum]QLG29038.1 VOC family protein [Halobaculum halophilum]
MDLDIDHVTVAGRDLDALIEAFTDAGFPAEYGGSHSNGVTHMAVVGFRDGTYLELVSTIDPDAASPWWHDPIHGDGGPCAWAVQVEDIATASGTFRERGVAVDGPHEYERERPDGTLVEWELSFLEEGDPGSTLPFLIADRTPRERRVTPTGDLATSPIRGVDTVVLAVADLEAAVDRVRTAFRLDGPERGRLHSLDADVASFPGTPVALAEPRDEGWLADRLDRFGPRPAAYLLGVEGGIESTLDVEAGDSIAGRDFGWLSPTAPVGRPYLGVIGADR